MTLRINDLGAIYEHEHYDVTFSHWGWMTILVSGTVEEMPWQYAFEVMGEIDQRPLEVRFVGEVSVLSTEGQLGDPFVNEVRIFSSDYDML